MYAVAVRRHEVGIRPGLGAEPGPVRSMFVQAGLVGSYLPDRRAVRHPSQFAA